MSATITAKPNLISMQQKGAQSNWATCFYCKLQAPSEDDDTNLMVTINDDNLCSVCAKDATYDMICCFCCPTCTDEVDQDEECKFCTNAPEVVVRPIYTESDIVGDNATYACNKCFVDPVKRAEAERRVRRQEDRHFYPLKRYEDFSLCRLCYYPNDPLQPLVPGLFAAATRVCSKCFAKPESLQHIKYVVETIERELAKAAKERVLYGLEEPATAAAAAAPEKKPDEQKRVAKRPSAATSSVTPTLECDDCGQVTFLERHAAEETVGHLLLCDVCVSKNKKRRVDVQPTAATVQPKHRWILLRPGQTLYATKEEAMAADAGQFPFGRVTQIDWETMEFSHGGKFTISGVTESPGILFGSTGAGVVVGEQTKLF